MKSNIIAVVLALACLGLGGGWIYSNRKAEENRRRLEADRAALGDNLVATTGKLTEQVRVNATLETNLSQRVEELNTFSNKWTFVVGELNRTEAEAKAAADAARAEIEKRDKQITGLEGEKDDLTKKMGELTGQIGTLETQIKDTERRLAASEGDREALKKELKRLLAEKAELERKFNDLAILREQVRRLKEELAVSRRLDFIKRGLYGFDKKGAQLVNEGVRPAPKPAAGTNAYPLKVEVGTDGSTKVETPPAK
jgi:chromosome segregation ATPase